MKKSKLITLFKTFSKDEMKEFGKFISSPYFSTGRNIKPLYNLLCKFHPLYNASAFTEEKIFRRLYPGKKFNEKKSLHAIHVQFSEMFILAEKFMVINGFEKGNFEYEFNSCLSKIYLDMNKYELSEKKLLKIVASVEKSDEPDQFLSVLFETYKVLGGVNMMLGNSKKHFEYTSSSVLYAYAYFMETISLIHNNYRIFKRNINFTLKGSEFAINFIKAFDVKKFEKDFTEDKFGTKSITLIFFYLLKSFISDDKEKCVPTAINYYYKNFSKYTYPSKWNLFVVIHNRCVGKSAVDIKYANMGNSLIDFVWGKGVHNYKPGHPIPVAKYLSNLDYKMRVLDFTQLEEFVVKYAELTEPHCKETTNVYSNACIYFKKKEYDKSLQLLTFNTKLPLNFKIRFYNLKLRCLYELGYYELAISTIDSLEHFSRNNKSVSDIFKTQIEIFVKALKLLLVLKNINDKKADIQKKKIVELTSGTLYDIWFREKLEEITCKT